MADETQTWKSDAKWATGLLFFALLAVSAWSSPLWTCPVGPQDASAEPACVAASATGPGEENLANLTTSLVDDSVSGAATDTTDGTPGQVVALETLAVLLVAALIGAVVIALKEPEHEGGGH